MAKPAIAAGRPWQALAGDDVARLLAAPVLAKTTHFSLHAARSDAVAQSLSTGDAPNQASSVDKLVVAARYRVALVVPKRYARRAVTRNLVKRQMRAMLNRAWPHWPGQELLIRQRGTFDTTRHPSAASTALREAVREELGQLLDRASRRI